MGIKCILCNKKTNEKHGHNPDPVSMTGRCCTKCNETKVIPARLFGPAIGPIEKNLRYLEEHLGLC